jgi:hypothetical protein
MLPLPSMSALNTELPLSMPFNELLKTDRQERAAVDVRSMFTQHSCGLHIRHDRTGCVHALSGYTGTVRPSQLFLANGAERVSVSGSFMFLKPQAGTSAAVKGGVFVLPTPGTTPDSWAVGAWAALHARIQQHTQRCHICGDLQHDWVQPSCLRDH